MSLFLRQKESNRIKVWAADILAAFAVAYGFLATLCAQLGLSFTLQNAFSGGLRSGLVACWNTAADTFGSTNFEILPQYAGGGASYGLFLTVLFLFLAVFALLIIKSRFLPGLVDFFLPQILLAVFYTLYPPALPLALYVVALLFAFVVMRMKGALWQAVMVAVILGAIGVMIFGLGGRDASYLSVKGTMGQQLRQSIADAWNGFDDLGHGDLTKGTRSIREGEALVVTMSNPQPMYLKGFSGAVFDGSKWQDLSDAVSYGVYQELEALKNDGFRPSGQLAQAALLSASEPSVTNEIRVQNTGADKRCAYVPYDLTEEGTLSPFPAKGGTEYTAGKTGQFKEYVYATEGNQVKNWTDVAARFFAMALNDKEPQEEADRYLIEESYYNVFIYDQFTQLSKEGRALLLSQIGDPGDQREGHVNYKMAISAIRSYLEDHFIYSEDPDLTPDGAGGYLQAFFESGKGYDVHFATAATLIFRYYGIPARYAEGYLITQEDVASKKSGDPISVQRKRTHAWTEIYIDGIGFVPLEVTPEFYGIMEEADMETGLSNEALMTEFQRKYGNTSGISLQEEPKEAETIEPVQDLKLLWIVLGTLAAIVLLLVLFWLIRKCLQALFAFRKRRKLFYQKDAKAAVAAIYAFMEEADLKPNRKAVALGNYAAYSPYKVTEKQRTYMLRAWKRLKKQKKEDLHGKKDGSRKA